MTHRTVTFNLEPNPNHQSQPPRYNLPLLILTSYSHSPPLNPPPHLKFDVRSLPNPPKNVRDAYDGTSKRLREWLIKERIPGETSGGNGGGFVERMDDIREVILGEMGKVEGADGARGEGEVVTGGLISEGVVLELGIGERETDEAVSGEERETEEEGENQGVVLRVGIFCEMGRHRSVAMVEELAGLKWSGWDVEIVHRDVERRKGPNGRRKHGRGTVFGGRRPE